MARRRAPVDLPRAAVGLATLDAVRAAHPGLATDRVAERTAAYVAGTLPGGSQEAPMNNADESNWIAVKLPPELIARADALLPALRNDPELGPMMGRKSRAAVIRLALIRGLGSLETRVIVHESKRR